MSWIPLIGELEDDDGHKFDDNMMRNIRRKPSSMIKQYPTTSGTTDIGYVDVENNVELAAVDWYFNNLLRGSNKHNNNNNKTPTIRRKLIGIIGQDDSADMQAQYLRGLEAQNNNNNNNNTTNNNGLNMTSWTATSFGSLILVGAVLIAYKRRMFGGNKSHHDDYGSDP